MLWLVVWLALAGPGQGIDERAAFYAAVEKAEQAPAEAIDELLALVVRAPADAFADDALGEAARLAEDKLGDPLRAAQLYQRLLGEYPDSRLGRRAEARLAVLSENLGPGGTGAAAQAMWNDLLQRFPERSRPQSIAIATRLLAEHPDFAAAARVDLFIAEQLDAIGEPWQALERYQGLQLRHPGTPEARRARRLEADLLTATGRFAEAARAFAELRASSEDPLELDLLDQATARLAEVRTRARFGWVAGGVGLAVLATLLVLLRRDAGSARAMARALVRPPIEAAYVLPVALVLGAAALSENQAIGAATWAICAISLAVAWFAGVGLREAGKPGALPGKRALAWAGGGFTLVACASYLVALQTGILELVIYTLTNHYD